MDEKRKQKYLDDANQVLDDVRAHLDLSLETGELDELHALQLLLEVTKFMHSEHEIHDLITLILDSALSFTGTEQMFLMLLDEVGVLRFKMGRRDNAYLNEADFAFSSSVVQKALSGTKPIIVLDTQNDPQLSKRQSIIDLDLRTIIATPLWYQDQLLGVIYGDSHYPITHYNDHYLNVLISLADQAAVAIFNAQKFETHSG